MDRLEFRMESSRGLPWILLLLCCSLRAFSLNAKNDSNRAVSFLSKTAQDTNMFVDFVIEQTAFQTNVLAGDISLRFRTLKSDAILFYCHDERRNFVQLELRHGKFLFKYNYGDVIYDIVSFRYVNDGKWHSLKIGNSWIVLDGRQSLNTNERGTLPDPRSMMKRTLRKNENIRLLQAQKRTYNSERVPLNSVTVFVGAVARGMGDVPAFVGCMSDLNIGGRRLNLTANLEINPKRLAPGCRSGCAVDSCRNGGRCLERWNGNYRCYCWSNAFVGEKCDKTVARALVGSGGVALEFPIARSVTVIGGKFGLMAAPRPGDLILHIDGTRSDVAIISGASKEIMLISRSRGEPVTEYRVSGSLADLQPPFVVRFWLWSSTKRLQLQLNDQRPLLGQWLNSRDVRAEQVNVGDPTAINLRQGGSAAYSHFKGCLYNLQIFVKGSDYPIEFSGRSDISSNSSSITNDQCPPFSKKKSIPVEENMTNSTEVGSVKVGSQYAKWMWYRIVIGVCAAMFLCLFIIIFIYTYHSCHKRSRRQGSKKGAYSQISYTHTSSVEGANGINRVNHIPSASTSPQHSLASTQLTTTPYKIPYRPPYVATSLVIRDGKHMAHIDSDVDLAEAAHQEPRVSLLDSTASDDIERVAMIKQARQLTVVQTPTLRRLPSPNPARRTFPYSSRNGQDDGM